MRTKTIHNGNGIRAIGHFKNGDHHGSVALYLVGVKVAIDVAVGTAIEGKVSTVGVG